MQFLTPLFWLGSVAIAVPVLLHLFRREKTQRIPFASLMFLRKIPIQQRKRRQLRYLFLLFLRCLGLLLLVITFTRPVITEAWFNRIHPVVGRSVLILIDHSLSMSRQEVWDTALATAEKEIHSLGRSDEGLIMQFGETAEVLSQWENTPDRLLQVLQNRVSKSYASTSYSEGLRMAVEQVSQAHHARKEICLITDLQLSGLSSNLGWKVPADVTVNIKNVGAETPNLFIEEARLEREVFSKEYPYPLLVRLGINPPQRTRGEVQLFLEGKLVDRQTFDVDEDHAELTFKHFSLQEGISRGKLIVEPLDSLPIDNVFFFVVEKQEPRKIVVFSGAPKTASAFYFKNALSSGRNRPFEVELVASFPTHPMDAEVSPLVVVDDRPSPPDRSLFESYVEQGGGLIVTLSKKVVASAYNQRWRGFLPVTLVERRFARADRQPFTSITEVNWKHPIFSVFRNANRTGILTAQFFSYWRLAPEPGANVIARFSEGDPALVEKPFGKGKILVFASSLDPIWTDFPLRSTYLPFWHRVTQYAVQSDFHPAAMKINQVLAVEQWATGDKPGSSGHWNVLDPRGQRVIGLDEERPNFIHLKIPGHYEIRSNKDTDWIAVNSRSSESELSSLSEEEFRAVFVSGSAQAKEAASGRLNHTTEEQQSLWWLFLIAAAGVFGIEAAVANRYSPATNSGGGTRLNTAGNVERNQRS